MQSVTIGVKGMTCMGCVSAVKRVLQAVEGVKSVDVSLEKAQAKLDYDAAVTDVAKLRAAVEDAGYETV